MPVISIALATFNGARYLEEQLDSIAAQTFSDFEVVVGDDGSSDGTREILERRVAVDSRFRILTSVPAGGLQRNFERLIAAATGEWIAPCDQDDIWESDKLAVLLAATEEPDVVMVYSDSLLVDATGEPMGKRAFGTMTAIDGAAPLVFAFANCVSGHAMMFHRRLLEVALPFPEIPIYDWWLAAAATSIGRVVRLNRPLVRYRQHDANITDMARRTPRRTRTTNRAAAPRRDREEEVSARLVAFARLPGAVGDAYRTLETLRRERASQWFAWSFGRFAWTNRHLLWAVKPGTYVHDLLRCAKLALGHRWFVLFRPRSTGRPPADKSG